MWDSWHIRWGSTERWMGRCGVAAREIQRGGSPGPQSAVPHLRAAWKPLPPALWLWPGPTAGLPLGLGVQSPATPKAATEGLQKPCMSSTWQPGHLPPCPLSLSYCKIHWLQQTFIWSLRR